MPDITIVPPEKSEIDILRAERDYWKAVAEAWMDAMAEETGNDGAWFDDEVVKKLIVLREAAGLL